MKQNANYPAAQAQVADTANDSAPPANETRRPRRMARQSDAVSGPAGAHETPATQLAKPQGESKIAGVLALLKREQGATLAELAEATSWLPHTTRAALTGLRKKGHILAKDKRGDVTCYRIAEPA